MRACNLALLAGFCLVLSVTGCTVGPDFRSPEPLVPAAWAGVLAGTRPLTPAETDLARWWSVFDDPILTSLVERAVVSNLDLKQAESGVRQARASRGIAASGLGPSIDAGGSFQRSRSPGFAGREGVIRGDASTTNLYQTGFDAGWELDIFGGLRRSVEAAEADLLAAVETRRDVLVTLTAEVARNYVELRAFQQRIDIARRNLRAQQDSARLTRLRFEAGFASGLDVANADAQVATTASQIPLLEASAQQSIYILGVLLGHEPAALLQELSPAEDIPAAPPLAPVGIPSDLLRRRPDIRRAEAEIHGATARIGVATADLFPKFSLTGSMGFQSSTSSSLFDWISHFWSFGPSATWRIFDTGKTLSNIELQKALEEQSVIAYRQTVLTALQEVENALVVSTKEQEHREALKDSVVANRKAVELARQLYVEGQTDFLSVLEAQRSLFATEDALTQSNGTLATNLIALYKALGGGWRTTSESER
ncbi:MAG: efflux transporter outer membrane subunit [Deltaproteobacteria bacterium]|nr:efflux transporter outer membrane subunit [Deltaproteobacteria bacterium]